MNTYAALVTRLDSLAKEAKDRSIPFNRDALGEALDALRDLDRLEWRVRNTMTQLLSADFKQAEGLMSMIRERITDPTTTIDPTIVAWFAKNPNAKIAGLSSGASANSSSLERNEEKNLQMQDLRIDSYAWYQRAHRLIKVVGLIQPLKTFKCSHVTIVRNHLMEHPEGKDSGVTHASFGYDSRNGPVVKSLRMGNQAGRHVDKGLFPASESLRAELSTTIDNAALRLGIIL